MKRVAIIGGGISGVSLLRELKTLNIDVHLYEKEPSPGGLIRCKNVNGHLYHLLGGHVFNSKNQQVLNWVKRQIPGYDEALLKMKRRADIRFDFGHVDYPIENSLNQLPRDLGQLALQEILENSSDPLQAQSFGAFLKANFGETLYRTYFEPYNRKIWGEALEEIPLDWLEGKLPMPTREEIVAANVFSQKEDAMVHSTFFYPKESGSQFWIDQLAQDEAIFCNHPVDSITQIPGGRWRINGSGAEYSDVVYTGDITKLQDFFDRGNTRISTDPELRKLKARGISNALCEIPKRQVTWTYLPEPEVCANRIINTGLFSPMNTPNGAHSAVLEFPFGTERCQMERDLKILFPTGRIIETNHVAKAYVIQEKDTRVRIDAQKRELKQHGFHLLGRFAEWEYYNMDMCIKSALDLAQRLSEGQPA